MDTSPIAVGFDFESAPLGVGNLVPRPSCLSVASQDVARTQRLRDILGFDKGVVGVDLLEVPAVGLQAVCTQDLMLHVSKRLLQAAADGDVVGIAHNLPFDLMIAAEWSGSVYEMIRAMVAPKGGFSDTLVREKLLNVATFGEDEDDDEDAPSSRRIDLSLAGLVMKYFGVDISGEKKFKMPPVPRPKGVSAAAHKEWLAAVSQLAPFLDDAPFRLKYCTLEDKPLSTWPERAVNYAIEDSVWALLVHEKQAAVGDYLPSGNPATFRLGDVPAWRRGNPIPFDRMIVDEDRQNRANLAFCHMAAYGLRADPEWTAKFKERVEAAAAESQRIGTEMGFVRANGTKDMALLKDLVEQAYKLRKMDVPRTETGQVQTSEAALAESGDPGLIDFASYAKETKLSTSNLSHLLVASVTALTSRPDVLKATGRASWSAPNLTNPPQKGGYREAFRPRPGWYYSFVDYAAAEMAGLAQVLLWLGMSPAMANAINDGKDLHLVFVANRMHLPYDEVVRRFQAKDPAIIKARQDAKAANFGFPGGMGVRTFIENAAKQGFVLTYEEGMELRDIYLATWGMSEYFDYVSKLCGGYGGTFTATQFVSMRQRGGVGFTNGANGYFQGIIADGAKRAAWDLCRASYTGEYDPPVPLADSPWMERSNPHAPPVAELGRAMYGARPVLFIHDEIGVEVPVQTSSVMGEAHAEIMRRAMQAILPDVKVGAEPALARAWSKGVPTIYEGGLLKPAPLPTWESTLPKPAR